MRDQLLVHADFFLPKDHRIINDLVDLRHQLSDQLGLPLADDTIEIYLFRDEHKFQQFSKRHHMMANRRAFFVKRGDRMMVFSYWGARAEEDLRHEVTHGYVHAVTRDLPLWLDEGIAEYFEIRDDLLRVNWPHVRLLAEAYRQGQWRPDLKPLEQIDGNASLSQLQYAEAWLWIHFLLHHDDVTVELLKSELKLAVLGHPVDRRPFSETMATRISEWRVAVVNHLKELAEL